MKVNTGFIYRAKHSYPFGMIKSVISYKEAGKLENRTKFTRLILNSDFELFNSHKPGLNFPLESKLIVLLDVNSFFRLKICSIHFVVLSVKTNKNHFLNAAIFRQKTSNCVNGNFSCNLFRETVNASTDIWESN